MDTKNKGKDEDGNAKNMGLQILKILTEGLIAQTEIL